MPKQIIGTVVSDSQDKTIVIVSHSRKTHPLYKKQYSVTKKFMAHDPKNEAKKGDNVIISESRPISSRKHFILTKITNKNILDTKSLEVIQSSDTNKRETKKTNLDKEEKKQ